MKALIHVAPRAGAGEAFERRLREIAGEWRNDPRADVLAINLMLRLPDDPLGRRTAFRAAFEITVDVGGPDTIAPLVHGLDRRLDDVAHPDLSTVLFGEEVVFVAGERAPIRYQYLMRRNASFDHDAYLKRYREIHSAFGVKTPGILGYRQVHVDPERSRELAGLAGLGVWRVDSVSELHLESLESFLAAVAGSEVPKEAAADEEIFVDRRNSFEFCSTVDWDERGQGRGTR
jgi:hypothetical protein